jgi:hypothetical protein
MYFEVNKSQSQNLFQLNGYCFLNIKCNWLNNISREMYNLLPYRRSHWTPKTNWKHTCSYVDLVYVGTSHHGHHCYHVCSARQGLRNHGGDSPVMLGLPSRETLWLAVSLAVLGISRFCMLVENLFVLRRHYFSSGKLYL